MRQDLVETLVGRRCPGKAFAEQWDAEGLAADIRRVFLVELPVADWVKEEGIDAEALRQRVQDAVDLAMAEKMLAVGRDLMRGAEKSLLLGALDHEWKDHLLAMDHLRSGINLRSFGQRDPLNEYKVEALRMFEDMLDSVRVRAVASVAQFRVLQAPQGKAA
jgi:preprotein translocase subunit SecA